MAPVSVQLGGKKSSMKGGTFSQQMAFLAGLALAITALNLPMTQPSGEGGRLPGAALGLVDEVMLVSNGTFEAAFQGNASEISAMAYRDAKLQLLKEENEWKNSIVLPGSTSSLPSYVQSWLRNLVFAVVIYLGLGSIWAYYIYAVFGKELFGTRMPGISDMLEQIKVSMAALPLYSMLPAFSEYMMEQGWTKAYPRLGEYGIVLYTVQFVVYIAGVELGVYWMHRSLHYGPFYKCAFLFRPFQSRPLILA